MADANIRAVITAQDNASSTLNKVGKNIENVGSSAKQFIGDAIGQATVVATAGLAALTAGAVLSVKAFEEQQNEIAQTNAVLKSTAGIAGVTADAVTNLATSLQKTTRYSDEQVRSVENLLLTFTKISKDTFPDATRAVLDMATALGEDTKSASIQLGKALQDPILGITALRRVGVNFSDAQKDVIKNLVDTGHQLDAQKMILKEIQTEFGGSAEAAGNTFAGSLDKLNNALNDVEETIGQFIVEGLVPLVQWAAKVVAAIDWTAVMAKVRSTLQQTADKVKMFVAPIKDFLEKYKGPLLDFMKDFGIAALILVPSLALLGATIAVITSPLFILTATLAALIFIFQNWNKHIVETRVALAALFLPLLPLVLAVEGVIAVWQRWSEQIVATGERIKAFIAEVVAGLEWLKNNWAEAIGYIIGLVATLPITIPLFFIEAMVKVIGYLATINWGAVFGSIGNAFVNMWEGAKTAALNALNYMKNLDWGGIVTNVGKGLGNDIIGVVNGAMKGAFGGVPLLKDHIPQIPKFAQGIENFSGGLAYVHQGEVLANLARGTTVIPKDKVDTSSSAPQINVTIQAGAYMGNPADARRYAQLIADAMKDLAGKKNMSAAEMLS